MTAKHEPADSRPQSDEAQAAPTPAADSPAADAAAPADAPATNEVGGQPDAAAQSQQDDLQARLAAAEARIAEFEDQLLRARAETENVRRRSQEEVAKARKFSIESFAESLVPVRDSLEAALAQKEQTLEALREGVEVTLRQLTAAFERNALKAVEPAPGDDLRCVFLWGKDCYNCNLFKGTAMLQREALLALGLTWFEADVYQDTALGRRFSLHGVPTFVLYRSGKRLGRITGWPGLSRFQEAIAKLHEQAAAPDLKNPDAGPR